jgi:hypothetical protein
MPTEPIRFIPDASPSPPSAAARRAAEALLVEGRVKPPIPASPTDAFVRAEVRAAFDALPADERDAYLVLTAESFIAPSDRPHRPHNEALLEGLRAAGDSYRAIWPSDQPDALVDVPPLVPIARAYQDCAGDLALREDLGGDPNVVERELDALDRRPTASHHACAYLRDLYGAETFDRMLRLH